MTVFPVTQDQVTTTMSALLSDHTESAAPEGLVAEDLV
jgi:hypothetical protein